MKNAPVVKKTKSVKVPVEPGVHFRLLCLTGENKGVSYYIKKERLILGRGDTADIQVLDTKSSREHAELKKYGKTYIVTDLGSQNGVLVNDLKIKQHKLANGDKFVIGRTVYRFNRYDVKKDISLVKDDEDNEEGEEAKPKDNKNTKKFLIYALLTITVFSFLFDDTKPPPPPKRPRVDLGTNSEILEEIAKREEAQKDKELRRKLDAYVHRGRREVRERNFFRAIEQFNLALILDPTNGNVQYLLRRSQQLLDEDIRRMFEKGKQQTDQLKYTGAMVTYCEVKRYLKDYPDDKRFIDAKKKIESIEPKLGKEPGEYKCY